MNRTTPSRSITLVILILVCRLPSLGLERTALLRAGFLPGEKQTERLVKPFKLSVTSANLTHFFVL